MSILRKENGQLVKKAGNVDYSEINELKQKLNKLEWNKIATTSGTTVVDLSQYDFKELLVNVSAIPSDGINRMYSVHIMKDSLKTTTSNRIYSGFGWQAERNILHIFIQSNFKANVAEMIVSNIEHTNSCQADWYIK